jgi:hypothetical protein
MARYLYFLFENSPFRDVAFKPTLKASLWICWVSFKALKPFSQDAFNHLVLKDLTDKAAAWVVDYCPVIYQGIQTNVVLFCLWY